MAAVASAHKVGRRHVAVLARDGPQARQDEKSQRIDQDGVGERKETHSPGAEHQRRHGDDSVGGVEIAADQKPGDERTEAPPTQTPFIEVIQVRPPPSRGEKADERHEQKKENED